MEEKTSMGDPQSSPTRPPPPTQLHPTGGGCPGGLLLVTFVPLPRGKPLRHKGVYLDLYQQNHLGRSTAAVSPAPFPDPTCPVLPAPLGYL